MNEAIKIYKGVLSGELGKFPSNFWVGEKGIENYIICFKYLIEEILKWDKEDIKNNLNKEVFIKYKLSTIIKYNGGIHESLNKVYPNIFKPWELKNCRKEYWNTENAVLATKWLIEEELKWCDNTIKNKISIETFKENGLYGMITGIFRSSVYECLNTAYPGRFNKYDIKVYYKREWDSDKSKEIKRYEEIEKEYSYYIDNLKGKHTKYA